MIYRRLSLVARLVAIVGIIGLMFFYWLVILDGEDVDKFTIWLLMMTVFVAGPLEILMLGLSFFKNKIGYNLSLLFSAPLLVAAVWIVFRSAKKLLFEGRGLDVLQIFVSGGFSLVLLFPFALIYSSFILTSTQNQKLKQIATAGVVSVLVYLFLVVSLFLLNTITLADE